MAQIEILNTILVHASSEDVMQKYRRPSVDCEILLGFDHYCEDRVIGMKQEPKVMACFQ